MSARPRAFLVDVRRGVEAAPPSGQSIDRSWRRWGAEPPTKYDRGIYLLVVASRIAASWPSHRNLSNSSFLRVLFWNRAARFVMVVVVVVVCVLI